VFSDGDVELDSLAAVVPSEVDSVVSIEGVLSEAVWVDISVVSLEEDELSGVSDVVEAAVFSETVWVEISVVSLVVDELSGDSEVVEVSSSAEQRTGNVSGQFGSAGS
jgi:hypothetical protein